MSPWLPTKVINCILYDRVVERYCVCVCVLTVEWIHTVRTRLSFIRYLVVITEVKVHNVFIIHVHVHLHVLAMDMYFSVNFFHK